MATMHGWSRAQVLVEKGWILATVEQMNAVYGCDDWCGDPLMVDSKTGKIHNIDEAEEIQGRRNADH